MNWNNHSNLEGKHAFLSASNYHWLNYDEDRLKSNWLNHQAIERGTKLHDLARRCIELGVSLPKGKKTLNNYVNDALAYRMKPEQVLYYSDNCFGTADSISFRNGQLRIHDLKTGVTPADMRQLEIYAALFCMEYGYKPNDIKMELRIYQNNEIITEVPEAKDIVQVIKKIMDSDAVVKSLKEQYMD